MKKPRIDKVWPRIRGRAGEEFYTISQISFTYALRGREQIETTRTWVHIRRLDFERALEVVPCDGPSSLPSNVMGPSYVWAILHDKRIRLDDY